MILTHIDLFSGIGGFALAAQWAGFETVAFVEIEPYGQAVIKQHFGVTPHDDIHTFDGTAYQGATLLTGGFPCQPFSQAGKRRGAADDRYLWPEMFRVIRESKPSWVLGENVIGIVNMELDRVLSDLEGEGYEVQTFNIPACVVDAKHQRKRVWIVGHAERTERRPHDDAGRCSQQGSDRQGQAASRAREPGEVLADDGKARFAELQRCAAHEELDRRRGFSREGGNGGEYAKWLSEPDVGRVAHGVSSRVDRLKGLGNAIVPQVAFEIIKGIAEVERHG